jgi:hypothetical protein
MGFTLSFLAFVYFVVLVQRDSLDLYLARTWKTAHIFEGEK